MPHDTISAKSRREIYKIAKKGSKIRSELVLNSTALTPVNFDTEKEKFFESKTYNPKFSYVDPPPVRFDLEIDNLEQRAEEINLPYDFVFHIIDYLNHLRFLYHARRSIGRSTFSIYAKLAYDWEIKDPDELLKSLPEFKFENEEKGKLVKASEISKQLRSSLKNKYKINDLPVVINHFTSNIIFVDFNKVCIGNGIKRFQNNVDRLIVHEIESHALQNYNMRKSNNPLLTLSKLSDSNLYSEGLGVYNEVKTKTLTRNAYINYYYRLKSVNNIHLSFRKMYEMLRSEGLSKKQSFTISYRVKRGMQDTSKPGGYPKDAAYLLGYKAVLDFLKENPEELMYHAKNPNITKFLIKYNLIDTEPTIIPDFEKNNNEY